MFGKVFPWSCRRQNRPLQRHGRGHIGVSGCHARDLASCRQQRGAHHCLLVALWLRVWLGHLLDACLRGPAMQSGELRALLCDVLHARLVWVADWNPHCGTASQCLWWRILGLDCLYGDELCGEFGDIWGGEGVGGWVESEGCVLMRVETNSYPIYGVDENYRVSETLDWVCTA